MNHSKRRNLLFSLDKHALKKASITIALSCILACLIGPVIINELYKLNRGYQTYFTPSDVLSFLGSALSAISSILLGVVTVYQTSRANEMSRSLMDLEFSRYKSEHRPYAILSECRIVVQDNILSEMLSKKRTDIIQVVINDNDMQSHWLYHDFTLQNTSNTYEFVSLEDVIMPIQDPNIRISINSGQRLLLAPGEKTTIRIYSSYSYYVNHPGFQGVFSILLENQFCLRYKMHFDILILEAYPKEAKNNLNESLHFLGREYKLWRLDSDLNAIPEDL